jgi:DNA-directed RNA polymerase subunit RPC12/RpoP
MMNSNLRPYQDLVNCHCHPDNQMIPDGDRTYRCSHCGWRIEVILRTPPAEWYQYEGNNDSSLFPRCVDCGAQTRMEAAMELPEGDRFFKVIVFACGPNECHLERLLNAYPVEVTREEYEVFGPSREESLSSFLEDVLLNDSGSEENLLAILHRLADRQWGEIDLSRFTAGDRKTLAHALGTFQTRGLLHQVEFKDDSVSFLIDDDVRRAYAEGLRLKAAGAQSVQ